MYLYIFQILYHNHWIGEETVNKDFKYKILFSRGIVFIMWGIIFGLG